MRIDVLLLAAICGWLLDRRSFILFHLKNQVVESSLWRSS